MNAKHDLCNSVAESGCVAYQITINDNNKRCNVYFQQYAVLDAVVKLMYLFVTFELQNIFWHIVLTIFSWASNKAD